jgi:hypothetical protein
MNKPQVVMMTPALPVDIRRWIEGKAAANLAPMNSAIVSLLRQQMVAELREGAVSWPHAVNGGVR